MHTLFSKSYKNNPTMKRWRVGIPLSIFLILACFSAQAQIPTNGLVAHYKLDGNANDASGNNNHGTPQGGVTWVNDRFGNCNEAASFDGIDDWITIPDNALMRPNTITVSAWVKRGSLVNDQIQSIFYKQPYEVYALNATSFWIKQNSGCLFLDGTGWQNLSTVGVQQLNQWYFITGIFDGRSLKFYQNNTLISENTNLPNSVIDNCAGGDFRIGRWHDASSEFFKGDLDDIRIYNRALTATEMQQLYTQTNTVSSCRCQDSTALVALYRATNMQNLPPQYKWNLSQPMTTWYGVSLNANGCVECLDLDGGAIDCGNLDPNPSGIGLVGTLPDSMRLLTSLQRLVLQGNTGLAGVLPTNFGNMTGLKQFYAYNCRFTPPFPASFWTLPNIESIDLNDNLLNIPFPSEFGNFKKLKDLHLCTTGLTGSIPTSLGLLDSLGNVDICDNNLTGAVPINLTTRTKMQVFQVESNKLDVLPKFDATRFQRYEPRFIPFFSVQNNRFTFDDIVPNMPIINRISATYAKQDSIFQTITYTKNVGETLTIDLGIDAGLISNKYVWIKNGIRFDSSNQNTLILRGVTPCDAGTYTCQVTNRNAPLLTLHSRVITVVINPIAPQNRNKTLCYGQKDTLPSGQIVAPTISTTYRETLRNQANTCDSVIITTNLTVIPMAVVSKIDSFCEGKTYTLTQRSTNNIVTIAKVYEDTLTAPNGCKTRYTTTLTYRSNLTRTERISLCTGEKYILPNGNAVYTEGSYISRKPTPSCDSLITTTVIMNQKPTAQIIGLTPFYCRDNTAVTLQGQPTGGAFRIDGTTASNFTPSVLSVGNHTISYVFRGANGCSDTAIQTVRLGDLGRNTISRVICLGDSVTIRGKVYHQRNLTGTDVLTGAAASGCDSIITVQVSLHQKVKAIDDAVEVLKNTKDVLIDVLANDIYPANLYDIKLLQNPNIGKVEELNNDKFKLTIPSSAATDIIFTYQLCHLNCINDCTIGTVRVKILDKGTELDPIITGISPNGDGKNDRLDFPQIDWRKYTKSTLEIYNRWGQKLYAAAPYQRDWDGKSTDGVLLPEGDYFFILRLIGSDGKIIAGSVYLSR
jgi:gliding motility-associated-like protein